MQLLKKLKIVLQSRIFYLILGVIVLSLGYFRLTKDSKLEEKITGFDAKILDYKIDGDTLSLLLKSDKKIKATYYFTSEEEKNFYQNNLGLGQILSVSGEYKKPSNNTIFNNFNYKKYLENKKIAGIYLIEKITIKDYSLSIQGLIKRRCEKIDNSGYLLAFILGSKNLIDKEEVNSYQINGISHLLAISGMHLTILAGIMLYLLKCLGFGDYIRYFGVILFLGFYAYLVSFTPSVMRALLFYILVCFNKLGHLEIKIVNLFLLTVILLLLWQPNYILDIGFLYSISSSLGLVLFKDFLNDNNKVLGVFKTSLVALIFTLPITINNFYQVNLLSLVANLFIAPLVSSLIFPLALLTFCLPFLSSLFTFFVGIMGNLSLFLTKIQLFNIVISKMSVWMLVIYYLLLWLFVIKRRKVLLIFLILLLGLNKVSPYLDSSFYVYFLDVGQGDATLLISNNAREVVLIDTGGLISYSKEDWTKKDKEYYLSDKYITFLHSLGITKINELILSHGDFDHMGEAVNLVNNFKVYKVIFNCGEFNELEQELIKTLNKKKIPYYSCLKELSINDNKLYFLQTQEYPNENDSSNVNYIEISGYKFLFMGDAGTIKEKDILDKYNLKDIDVLKVGHHGSNTSSSKEFIDEINPKYSIISVGKNNRYGHPKDRVLDNLENSKIYRTDLDGTIEIKLNKNGYKIRTCPP